MCPATGYVLDSAGAQPPPSPGGWVAVPPPKPPVPAVPRPAAPRPAQGPTQGPVPGRAGAAYGTPYGQPAPAGAYGTPSPPTYGAPAGHAYAGPPTPNAYAPAPNAYGAPASNAYGVPAPNAYGAPAPNAYAPASNAYGAPAPNAYAPAPNAYAPAPNAYGGAPVAPPPSTARTPQPPQAAPPSTSRGGVPNTARGGALPPSGPPSSVRGRPPAPPPLPAAARVPASGNPPSSTRHPGGAVPASAPGPAQAQDDPKSVGVDSAQRRQLVGRVIGDKYGVTAVIGEGGMGSVYEAEHLHIGRLVAVKVLHPKEAEKREAITRMEHEARVAGRIGHPNICEVYDIGRLPDGSPYLVMERLQGETLAQRLLRTGPVPPYELVDIILQVLSALVAAHERHIIHRDLKPENIFLSARAGMLPVAKLLDFGISKASGVEETAMDLTRTGMVMGTPYYMAPEQARGERDIDHRVDLWAVGVILYETLTGQRPFVAKNYNALLVQIITSWHRPVTELDSSIPSKLSRLIDKALAKSRDERFQSAREFQEALRRFKKRWGTSPPKRAQERPQERLVLEKIVDETTDDGTMVFARLPNLRGGPGSDRVPEVPAAGPSIVVASHGFDIHDPTTTNDPEPPVHVPVLPQQAAPRSRLRVRTDAPSSSRGPQLRAEIEDPQTPVQSPRPPRSSAHPAEDADATVVDPPAFLEDDITMVRRDPRSRGDRS